MRVLLSIRPVHVESILSGAKRFEFRRKLFTRRDVSTVLVYCTMPVGRLVAEFDIAGILEDEPEQLWRRTETGSGISKAYYDEYFDGRSKAYALAIGDLRIYKTPVIPTDVIENFTPPQSYRYVPRSKHARQLELL
jgi:predicted transcriptional regulator